MKSTQDQVKYYFDENVRFVIENYNESKTFSNFFPGISGLWGIPMWVFYVNRGQGISSFGIESKDKAILEFQPANKAYQLTPLQGFRTFIKAKSGTKIFYWEPFQKNLLGTNFKKMQKMFVSAEGLSLEEVNEDLGLVARVNYFTIPQEPYAGLVRQLTIENIGRKKYTLEIIDGLPRIVPFGLGDWTAKHMCRTVEAWIKVRHWKEKTPFYQLNVEVADTPQVKHIKDGNFYFAFDAKRPQKFLDCIVESNVVFGEAYDFSSPEKFLDASFAIPEHQETSNRTPSALSYFKTSLNPRKQATLVSVFGHTTSIKHLKDIKKDITSKNFIELKEKEYKAIIDQIKDFAFTKSSSFIFDAYAGHTFLDNVLRGGLPISLKTSDGYMAFNVYSRKHGDPERDYNFFVVAPTFYSQGNGNYRDVNQNRRNDAWFNPHVKDHHLINFLNLIQADGYNPLVVKGTTFKAEDEEKVGAVLDRCLKETDKIKIKEFLKKEFSPGELLKCIFDQDIVLKVKPKDFMGRLLEVCHKQELADHGEGFWIDHWTYNLDLIESYLSLYPDDLKNLLLGCQAFSFYHNGHYVLPRDKRYILTQAGVRQYSSVGKKEHPHQNNGNKLRIDKGAGPVYYTHLVSKILCLLANKVASLDPSGIGVEMEANKPSWYDALNGLPGLLGSSICETLEMKRLAEFLLEAINELALDDQYPVNIFEELAYFIEGLSVVLASEKDDLSYWEKSNSLKEHYRFLILDGIEGREKKLTVEQIKIFLKNIIEKTEKAFEKSFDEKGFLRTYFYHEVIEYERLSCEGGSLFVRPLKFKKYALPLFLEGYVHALKVEKDSQKACELYRQVRHSGLYDKKLKMYKVNEDLSTESEEIGRTRIFPSGWLENESVWIHMEYKFMLELLRRGMAKEFYENFKNVFIPFLAPEVYGRSILENSSFIVSSAHEDKNLHGRGFVARLSGSTAEFVHIWLGMNVGLKPFVRDEKGALMCVLNPCLSAELFTSQKSTVFLTTLDHQRKKIELPAHSYVCHFLSNILLVYHNPKAKNTFGSDKVNISEIHLTYPGQVPVKICSSVIGAPYAQDIRDRKVERIDVYLK
ncbi:MAG TPA: hypothetical protein PLH56_01955 [Candidatus Omnitrophota bacterium]|nr:hypothetical protein [Candidatus Omnitrophota bacterium]